MQRLKDCLLRRFRIKDFRDLKYVLGIEFSRSKAGVYMSQRKYALDTEYGTHRCSSRQILKVAIPKTHTGRWRVIKGSSQIQRTCGTTDIPHGYSTWHSVFDSDSKSIYTGSMKTSLGWHNLSLKSTSNDHRDKDCYCHPRTIRHSQTRVLHFSWFFYYLIDVQKIDKSINIICENGILRDDQ